MQLVWDLPKNTKIARSTLTPRLHHKWEQVNTCGSEDTMANFQLLFNIIQHDWFGRRSVIVIGGIFLKGCRDLNVLAYITPNPCRVLVWNCQRYCQTLHYKPFGSLYSGFLPVHYNAQSPMARMCGQFLNEKDIDTVDWSSHFPELNLDENLKDVMYWSI